MKRFYREAGIVREDGAWRVVLDGRAVRTQGGRPQLLTSAALADALAAEWAAQGDEIEPASFVLRDLADFAIDAVADDPAAAVTALLPYAETDTLCYRAEPEEPLHARQTEVWEPLLRAVEARYDVHFERVSGIIHRPQPADTIARMQAVIAAQDPWALAALRTLTNLSASLVISLAALEPGADAEALWNAANLEEDWQAELWGEDYEAQERRARRLAAFAAAMRFAALARG